MNICLPNLRTPAIVASLLTLPFLLLELLNNGANGFPLSLFGFLWLLPVIFTATLTPIVTYARAGGKLTDHPATLLVRVLMLVFLGALWVSTLADQMPCFLGYPNCD